MLLFSFCTDSDPCQVPCLFGDCQNERCNCLVGYEGDSCHIKTIDRYVGTWTALDTCQTNLWGYTAYFRAKSLTQLGIENFGGFGTSFVALGQVAGDTLTILAQTVQGISLSGTGRVTEKDSVARKMAVYFTLSDEWGNTDTCRCLWQRQQ